MQHYWHLVLVVDFRIELSRVVVMCYRRSGTVNSSAASSASGESASEYATSPSIHSWEHARRFPGGGGTARRRTIAERFGSN